MATATTTNDRQREAKARWSRQNTEKNSEIGPLPPVVNPGRRKEAADSLRRFCEIYRKPAFYKAWSPDHLRVIARLERAIRDGGLFALAMPRGSGKTTLAITAAIWALLNNYRRWVCLIGATAPKAKAMLKSIQTETRFNPLLLADYPEACYPIVKLQGQARRAIGQTLDGVNTNIGWSKETLQLPIVTGSPSSGARVSVCGITGDIRGQFENLPDGRIIRPDFVLPDDPQTRESAKSRQQTDDRLATLQGDVLGLAGPGVKISGVMPCTVIVRGDMADQVLDREQHPEWGGERTKLLRSMPKNMALWEEYHEMRDIEFRNDGDGSQATEFYRQHQDDMDDGAGPSWPERFNIDEISAVQNGMNLFFRDEAAFAAEYQNEPLDVQDDTTLSADQIAERIHPQDRGIAGTDASVITAFIDVQQQVLFWMVVAWSSSYRGWILDYGSFPDQRTTNFRLSSARHTLARKFPGSSMEAAIRKGLEACVSELCSKPWRRDDGAELSIQRLLIDANWGKSRDIVYTYCRESPFRSVVLPSHGKFVGASSEPLNAKNVSRRTGKKIGTHWFLDKARDNPSQYCVFDTNFWKSFVHQRLSTDAAERTSLTLYSASPRVHKTLSSHLKAEYPVRVEGRGRVVDEWKIRPERPDNHWFDCLVGCAVAASITGVVLSEQKQTKQTRPRMTLAEMAQQK